MEDIKITLAAARVNAKLTQDEVAKQLKVGKKTIGNWENGITEPSYAALCLMSEMYGIPIKNISLPKAST